jgi:hypothetical protein
VPCLQQTFRVKVAHVHAMTLIGLVCISNLYQLPLPTPPIIFSPTFCRNHKASCTTPEQATVLPLGIVYLASQLPHDAEHDRFLPLWQASALPKYGTRPHVSQSLQRLFIEDRGPLGPVQQVGGRHAESRC